MHTFDDHRVHIIVYSNNEKKFIFHHYECSQLEYCCPPIDAILLIDTDDKWTGSLYCL